ncbi:MAG: LamG domain-containing protein, partial [Candidatus Pacearchaeota archaeon]
EFDGSDDYVEVPEDKSFDSIKNEITLSAWVNFDSVQNWDAIINKRGSGTRWNSLLRHSNQNTYAFRLNNGSRKIITSKTEISVGEWQHVLGTWNGSVMEIYINGEKENSSKYTGTLIDTDRPLRIGRATNGNYPLNGTIDEVR